MGVVILTDEPARRGLGAVLAMGRVLPTTASYQQAVAAMVAAVSQVVDVETCPKLEEQQRQLDRALQMHAQLSKAQCRLASDRAVETVAAKRVGGNDAITGLESPSQEVESLAV